MRGSSRYHWNVNGSFESQKFAHYVSLKHEGDKMMVFGRGTAGDPLVFVFRFHPTNDERERHAHGRGRKRENEKEACMRRNDRQR
jgi:Alpha amylase, C-terminal all-beta domain